MTDDPVLARITASAPRRVLGIGTLAGLAFLLAYMALAMPSEPVWQVLLLLMAAGAVWLAWAMYHATASALELTATELRDTAGTRLALITEIEAVDRGAFALKPSSGFTLKLYRPQARSWRPGLWWRLGRRVAVGGVTSGSATRPVADIIAAMIAGAEPPR